MSNSPTNKSQKDIPSRLSLDPLGESLHFLQMTGYFYTRSELSAPWGIGLPAIPQSLMFHVVTEGRCWLHVEGQDPQLLRTGDLALVPHGEGHILSSEPNEKAENLFDIPRIQVSEKYELLQYGKGGALTQMICGAVQFEHPAALQLVKMLPKTMCIDAWNSPQVEWIQSTLRLMAAEAQVMRPGGETIITRLADILVIQTIRSWLSQSEAAKSGWLGALKDPQIGQALLLIQKKPDHPWTIASLADAVAMSRSSFAQKFKSLVGETPIQYITRWRMGMAKMKLQEGNHTVAEIAEQFGYQSEAAFSRTFKKVMGRSPGAVRREKL